MGKYAATRAFQRKSSSGWRDVGNSLYGPIRSESDYRFQSFVAGADPTGLYRAYLTSRDSTAYMRDYLNNRNLDWSNIRYPSRTIGFGSDGAVGRSALMLGSNIMKLYL